jgi:hypothetical protein
MSFTRPIDHLEVAALEAASREIPADWADSLTKINKSVRALSEALPQQDKKSVVDNLLLLEESTKKLREFLVFRELFADSVTTS